MASIGAEGQLAFVAAALSALTEKKIVTKKEYDRIDNEVKSGTNKEYACAGQVNVVEEIKQTYAKTAELVAERYFSQADDAEISRVFGPEMVTKLAIKRSSNPTEKYKQLPVDKDARIKPSTEEAISGTTKIRGQGFRERMSSNGNFPFLRKIGNGDKMKSKPGECKQKPLLSTPKMLPPTGTGYNPSIKPTTKITRTLSDDSIHIQPASKRGVLSGASPMEDESAVSKKVRKPLSRRNWKGLKIKNSVEKNKSSEDIHEGFLDTPAISQTDGIEIRKHGRYYKLFGDKDSDTESDENNSSSDEFVVINDQNGKERKKTSRARHVSRKEDRLFDSSSSEEDNVYRGRSDTELLTDKLTIPQKLFRTEKTVDLLVILPSGKTIVVEMESTSNLVNNVKYKIKEKTGIVTTEQVLQFGGKILVDDKALHEYKIRANSTIHLSIKAKGGARTQVFFIDNTYLDPQYDYDFTKIQDGSTKFMRGGYPYNRPCGWNRYAIKVIGKYENVVWLGQTGKHENNVCEEWAVTYHGTKSEVFNKIAPGKYIVGSRAAYGPGVYSSPSIKIAESFATVFKYKRRSYVAVFQNRVNPRGVRIVNNGQFWICPDPVNIRPYGLCVRRVKK